MKINKNAELISRLPQLLDALRAGGFTLGAGEYAAAHRLLLRLAQRGELPDETLRLSSLLAPLLCSSPEEQKLFAHRFRIWAGSSPSPAPVSEEIKEIRKLRKWELRLRWRPWMTVLTALGILSALLYFFPMPRLHLPPAPFWGQAALLIFLMILIRDLCYRLIVGRYLRRGSGKGPLRRASFYATPEHAEIFPPKALDILARQMRVPELSASKDLNIPATVEQSIRAGGRFCPVRAVRRRSPQYLVLTDRRTFRDHGACRNEHLLEELRQREVPLEIFRFDKNPRICFPYSPGSDSLHLDLLARRYPHYRLLVFSDGEGFFRKDIFSVWKQRALFITEHISDTFPEDFGKAVFPADEKGLAAAVQVFCKEEKGDRPPLPQPGIRVADSPALHWNEAPHPDDLEELIKILRKIMGDAKGWLWFCSTAIYPELRWGLTLHLGKILRGPDEQSLFSRERLLRLCGLPWFRRGAMPDWLRTRLMEDEAFYGETAEETRGILFLLLRGVGISGTLEMEAAAMPSFLPRILRRMKKEETDSGSPLHDPVFMTFMCNPLATRLPRAAAKLIRKILGKAESVEPPPPPPPQQATPGIISNALGMNFVYIPPGEFMMGSPEDEPGRYEDEKLHKVILTQGFYMQDTPVTQGQWQALMGNNPSHFKEGGPECPVEKVSWEDAQEFIRKLSEKDGENTYRLPTEAEWEYACRAGTDTPYYTGKTEADLDRAGWYSKNSGGKTHPVRQKEANAWGLYDMHGNVWEWCQDWYGEYPEGTVTDPAGPDNGTDRVYRGGSWIFGAGDCRSDYRGWDDPGERGIDLGFRVLAVPAGRAR